MGRRSASARRTENRRPSETMDKDLALDDNASPSNGDILIEDRGEGDLETLARLKQEVSDMSRERVLLTDKLAEMGQQTDLLQRQKHEFESQVGELQAERDFLSRERGALENYVSDLRNRVQANEAEQREISEQREDAWETERQGLISALSESTHRISDLAAEVEDLQTRNNVMLEQCVRSDRLVNQVSIEEEELRINVDSLNKRLEMLTEENESLRLESALKAQALWSLEEEVRKLSADIAAVEEEKATLSALNSRMESESAAFESRLAEAVKSTERHDVFVEGLQAENGKLASEKAILQRKIDEMGASLAELSSQLDARGAENRVAELQAELAATRSAYEEASITSREIREDRESLAKKMGLQCSRNKELEDDLISLRSSYSNNQQRINDLEQQVSTLASEKRGLEDANRLLQIELNRQILGSAAEDHEQFGERIGDRGSANTVGEPRDVKIQQPTLDHPTYQLHSDQVGERIRDLEIALDATQKALASREMTVQQLTAELQSLQSSFETKQKGKQIAWPAVAASTGAVVAAACLVYVKCSKQR